jgi:exodeoxyribonuclease III
MGAAARGLKLLTLNVGNPSEERAQRQLEWLAGRREDVLVLTETKASTGCQLLSEAFRRAGYLVFGDAPPAGQYGVMVASRLPLEADWWAGRRLYQRERAVAALLRLGDGSWLRIIGVYVPSRDASAEKVERKRRFLAELGEDLADCSGSPLALLGDLNILEPDHRPRYPFFKPFEYEFYRRLGSQGLVDAYRVCCAGVDEYSWVGRTGDGYRYDHAFVSGELGEAVTACCYVHEIRVGAGRWTDHSALTLELDLPVPERLPSDPAALLLPRLL